MKEAKLLNKIRDKRARRVRKKISRSVSVKPRLSVFRSNKNIYAQIIDYRNHKTLVSFSSKNLKEKSKKTDLAAKVGESIAKKAIEAKIKIAVVDRGSYLYHGRVKALIEGARKGGLKV